MTDEYLTDEQLETLNKLVRDRLEAIIEQSRKTVSEYTEVRERDADPVDLASAETDLAFSQRMGERDRQMAAKLQNSLERIKASEYGVCENCGDEITYRRLLARPVATLCIDCKTTNEMLENPGRRRRRG